MTRARDLANIIGPNGDLVVTGDLQVSGTTTTVNSTTVEIADKNILLGSGATTNSQNSGAGLSVLLPDASPDEFATILWDATGTKFDFSHGASFLGNVYSGTLIINPQDGINEGGEIVLSGAGSNENINIDNYAGTIRIFDSSSPTVRLTINSSGDATFTGNIAAPSGNVFVGKSDATLGTDGTNIANTSTVISASSGNTYHVYNTNTSTYPFIVSFDGTVTAGAITSSGAISARDDYDISTQNGSQLVLYDNTTPALNMRFSVDTAIGSNGGGSIQITESNVSNDRELKLNPFGGKVGVNVSSGTSLSYNLQVDGTLYASGDATFAGNLNISPNTIKPWVSYHRGVDFGGDATPTYPYGSLSSRVDYTELSNNFYSNASAVDIIANGAASPGLYASRFYQSNGGFAFQRSSNQATSDDTAVTSWVNALTIDSSSTATFSGAINTSGDIAISKSNPFFSLNGPSSKYFYIFNDANNSVIRSSEQMLLQIGSISAITIDTSRNATFAGTIATPSTITASTGDRPVTVGVSGSLTSKGSSGGWSMGHLFYGSSDTYRGGFGAAGGADTLTYYWIGPEYNDPNDFVVYPTGNVVISNFTPTNAISSPTGTKLEINSNTDNYISFRNALDNGTYAGITFTDNNLGGYVVFRNHITGSTPANDETDCLIFGAYQDFVWQTGTSGVINGKDEKMRLTQGGDLTVTGRFDSSNAKVLNVEYSGSASTAGWYTIASYGSGRASSTFHVYDTDSGAHNYKKLEVTWSYGQGGIVSLSQSRHSTTTISQARLLYNTTDQTYGGCYLQVYTNNPCTLRVRQEPNRASGWEAFTEVTPTLQNTIANFALSTQLTQLNLNGGIGSSGTAYLAGVYSNGNVTIDGLLSNFNNGARLEIQGQTDGGNGHGIYMWDSTDANWVIYMSQAGAGKSSSGGTAASGLDGRTSHAIRYRVADSTNQIGHLFENASEEALFQIQPDTGNIYSRGTLTQSASDERLKTNIKNIENPLEKLKKIRGVEFDWLDNIEETHQFKPRYKHETGVIAQEIEQVIPDAVSPAPFNNEYKTVEKDKLVALLIEAVKEQQKQIEELKELLIDR